MTAKFWVSVKYIDDHGITHSTTVYDVIDHHVSNTGIILFKDDGTYRRFTNVQSYHAEMQKEGNNEK